MYTGHWSDLYQTYGGHCSAEELVLRSCPWSEGGRGGHSSQVPVPVVQVGHRCGKGEQFAYCFRAPKIALPFIQN